MKNWYAKVVLWFAWPVQGMSKARRDALFGTVMHLDESSAAQPARHHYVRIPLDLAGAPDTARGAP